MKVRTLHPWGVTVAEAREIQERLRGRVRERPPPGFRPRTVAGADVAFWERARRTWACAAVVVLRLPDLEPVEEVVARVEVRFPYVPGLLSFREIPALVAAWERLRRRPDVLVLDAHGRAHPRRMGLACHAGLVFGVPTVGCAKSLLVGTHGPLRARRGAYAAIVHEGDVVGCALRTRTGVRPVYVSVGHRVSLAVARRLILRLTPGGRYRVPEPIRRAHEAAGRCLAAAR